MSSFEPSSKEWSLKGREIARSAGLPLTTLSLGLENLPLRGQRLVDMLNDSGTTTAGVHHYRNNSMASNKRIAEIVKLFCMQENLTYEQLGFSRSAIRNLNYLIEMPLDLRSELAWSPFARSRKCSS